MVAVEGSGTYAAVIVEVNNVICRALLDTDTLSSYVSLTLLEKMNTKPFRKETKCIEMMMYSTVRKIDVFEFEIEDLC